MTIVTSMNAAVTFVPTLQEFPRSNMKAELLDSAPPDLSSLSQGLVDQERELYAMVQTFFPLCESI